MTQKVIGSFDLQPQDITNQHDMALQQQDVTN
jgi:hypothetical protein